jgi:hypothetical protein
MNCSCVLFTGHALRRMFQRGLGKNDIIEVLKAGECFAEYPEDRPYPNGTYLSKKGRHCERSAAISCYGISYLEIATSLRSSQ